jgi:hypothetical protein
LIVVAKDANVKFHCQIDAIAWVRSVTNNVAQAKDPLDVLFPNVFEHSAQGFQITVQITNYGRCHDQNTLFTPGALP